MSSKKIAQSPAPPKNAWMQADQVLEKKPSERNIVLVKIDGFIGLKLLIKREGPLIRRLAWLFVVVACYSVLFVLITERVHKYASSPLSIRRKSVRSASLPFPKVLVCPFRSADPGYRSYHLNHSMLAYLWTLSYPGKRPPLLVADEEDLLLPPQDESRSGRIVDFDGVLDLLREEIEPPVLERLAKLDLESRILKCKVNQIFDCAPEYVVKREVHTPNGWCLRYDLIHPASSGPYQGLKILFNASRVSRQQAFRFTVLLQRAHQSPDVDTFINGMEGMDGWHKNIILSLTQFTVLNLSWKPCDNDEIHYSKACHARCLETAFTQKYRCRLTFMEGVQLPVCKGSEYVAAEVELLRWLSGHRHFDCTCTQPCKLLRYDLQMDSADIAAGTSSFHVFYTEAFYDDYEEIFSYDIYTLLSDFGGIIGLLVGLSVMSLVKMLEYCWHHLRKKPRPIRPVTVHVARKETTV